jgi:hypothetical protein
MIHRCCKIRKSRFITKVFFKELFQSFLVIKGTGIRTGLKSSSRNRITKKLRGERMSMESSSEEKKALWKEEGRGEILQGEKCSMEKSSEDSGTSWRESSRVVERGGQWRGSG